MDQESHSFDRRSPYASDSDIKLLEPDKQKQRRNHRIEMAMSKKAVQTKFQRPSGSSAGRPKQRSTIDDYNKS